VSLYFPTIKARKLWSRYFTNLEYATGRSPHPIRFEVDESKDMAPVYASILQRVHQYLLSLSVAKEWGALQLVGSSPLYRLETSMVQEILVPANRNLAFVLNVHDVAHYILLQSRLQEQRPSQVLQTMSIYEYHLQDAEHKLRLVALSEDYGYMDAEKWAKHLSSTYQPSFVTPSTGNSCVLATYFDENQENLQLHGFLHDRTLWTYPGQVDSFPEVVLTATTISEGAVSTGRKVDTSVFFGKSAVKFLDFRYGRWKGRRDGNSQDSIPVETS